MQRTPPKIYEQRLLQVDVRFVDRVIQTSLIITLLGLLVLFSLSRSHWAFGFGIGALVNIFGIAILKWSIERLLGGRVDGKRSLFAAKVLLVKLPAILVILVLSIQYLSVNLIALLIGLSITQIVLLLKLCGILFAKQLNAT